MLGGVYCPRAQPKTTPAMVAAESSPWLLENKQQQNQHTRLALQVLCACLLASPLISCSTLAHVFLLGNVAIW